MKVKVWWNDRWQDGQLNVNVVDQKVTLLVASQHQAVSVPFDGEQADDLIAQLDKARTAVKLIELAKKRDKLPNLREVEDCSTSKCCGTCRLLDRKERGCPEELFTSVCDLYKPLYEWPDGSRREEPPPGVTDATD